MKSKKHNKIVRDYDKQKSKHLENLANQILKAMAGNVVRGKKVKVEIA